eukprot:COSAG06_NODE_6324_length_2983_cov_1.503121_7_plen_82_part_00
MHISVSDSTRGCELDCCIGPTMPRSAELLLVLLLLYMYVPSAGISPPGASGSIIFGGGRAEGSVSFFVRGGSALQPKPVAD